jgi:hypothetical protein
MQYLSTLRLHAGRPVEDPKSLMTKTGSWHLLAQGGSATTPHQDHCGFCTWVRVEEGKKLWLICKPLSNEDQATLANDGGGFIGGQWYYVWLEPGDLLVMPPGTVHAVFTPVNTLCTGGFAWSQLRMGSSMMSIAFESENPSVTNDDDAAELSLLLDETYRRMQSALSVVEFGGEEEVEKFKTYYQVCGSLYR